MVCPIHPAIKTVDELLVPWEKVPILPETTKAAAEVSVLSSRHNIKWWSPFAQVANYYLHEKVTAKERLAALERANERLPTVYPYFIRESDFLDEELSIIKVTIAFKWLFWGGQAESLANRWYIRDDEGLNARQSGLRSLIRSAQFDEALARSPDGIVFSSEGRPWMTILPSPDDEKQQQAPYPYLEEKEFQDLSPSEKRLLLKRYTFPSRQQLISQRLEQLNKEIKRDGVSESARRNFRAAKKDYVSGNISYPIEREFYVYFDGQRVGGPFSRDSEAGIIRCITVVQGRAPFIEKGFIKAA